VVAIWMIDATLDSLLSEDAGLWSSILNDVPGHFWHDRVVTVGYIVLLGLPLAAVLFRRRQLRQALADSELRIRTLFSESPLPYQTLDKGAKILEVNSAWLHLMGYSKDEVIGKSFEYFLTPSSAQAFRQCQTLFRTGKEASGAELELVCKGGGIVRGALGGKVACDETGETHSISCFFVDVTERHRYESALKASEEKYRFLIEHANEAIFVAQDAIAVFCNSRMSEIVGYPVDRINTSLFVDYIHPEDRSRVMAQYARRLSGEKIPGGIDFRVLTPDGTYRWLEGNGVLIEWGGRPATLNFANDITERKQAELALQEERRRLADIITGTHVGTWEWNVQTGETVFSERWAEIVGYSLEELAPISLDTWIRLTHPDDLAKAQALLDRHFNGELDFYKCEQRMRHKNGSWVWILDSGKVHTWLPDGKPLLMSGMHLDITERKNAELTLLEERRRLADIIRGTNVGTWEHDVTTGVSQISARWADILGYTLDELTPLTMDKWNELVHPDDLEKSNEVLRQHLSEGRDFYECELRMRHKDGHWVWILDRGRVHTFSEDGKPLLMSGTHQEITERKRAEEALQQRESYLSAIIENQPGLIWLKDTEGRFLSVNREFARSCGKKTPDDVIGRTDFDIWPSSLADKYRADDNRVIARARPVMVEEEILDKGASKWFETFKTPVFDKFGNVIGTTGYAHDVTERKSAEKALRRSEERYRIVTEQTGQMVYDWDVKTGAIRWGGAIASLTGSECESYENIGIEDWRKLIHPDDRQSVQETMDAAVRSGAPYVSSYRLLRKDGTCVFVEDKGVFVKDNSTKSGRMLGRVQNVTERKKAREELESREKFLQAVFDGIQDGICVLDEDLTVLRHNKTIERWHQNAVPLVGKKCYEAYHGLSAPCPECPTQRALVMKSPQTGELRTIGSNGKEEWNEIHAFPLLGSEGKCNAVIEYVRDVTERHATEQSIVQSENKYRTLFESAQDSIFLMKDYIFVDCNSTTCRMFNCSRDDIVGQSPARFSPETQPDGSLSMKSARDRMNRALSGVPQFFEWTHSHLDGTPFDAEVSLNAIEIAGEQYILALVRDITARKQVQHALERSLSLQQATIESTADGILVVDSAGKITSLNRRFLELFRIPDALAAQTTDDKLLEFVASQLRDPEMFLRRVSQLYSSPESQSYDILEFADGRVFERHSLPQRVGLDIVGRVWSFRDLTERRSSEMELARLATAIEQAAEAIIITDLDGRVEYVNPAFERTTGYSRDEAANLHVDQLCAEDQKPDFQQTLRAGEVWSGRLHSRRKDGTTYEEECSMSPIRDQLGTVINYVAVKRDVTQEVELENRLRQSQKLEAVGLLAAGIAHDFNNLLAGIKGFAELLTMEKDCGPKVGDFAEEILKAANRAADLTGQLLAFARKGRFLSILVNVNEVIGEVAAILRHSIDRRIEIQLDLRATRPFVSGDPSQIQSAILNLAINARDAMPEGGKLSFMTEEVHLDEHYCQLHSLDLGAGDYVAVTVADTGVGMDESIIGHIFDPFFTTKEQGQGTGLGLAGVYGCLRNHHGTVEVTSQPGKGSTFKLLLPASAAEPEVSGPRESKLKLSGWERLMIVEDEEIVRKLAVRILANAGYRVTACADGQEAIELYRKNPSEFDLILLDMMMPKMHGKDVFLALRKINPNICTLLMSGYSDKDVQELLDQGIKGFVSKPFRSKQLLQKVREALDGRSAEAKKQSQPS
jgi:two-component system, cell cycle sensor histidine kinase and response regulator CckA